jgi:SUMO ligase MMS21 Smc5/6 complex component
MMSRELFQPEKQPAKKNPLIYRGQKMKDEYDFSNAEQGKFYVPVEEIQMPIYLDQDVMQFLNKKCDFNPERLQDLINKLLRKDIEIAQEVEN